MGSRIGGPNSRPRSSTLACQIAPFHPKCAARCKASRSERNGPHNLVLVIASTMRKQGSSDASRTIMMSPGITDVISHPPSPWRLVEEDSRGTCAQRMPQGIRKLSGGLQSAASFIVAFRQSDGLKLFCCPRTAKSESGCGGVRLCGHFHARPSRSGIPGTVNEMRGRKSVGVNASRHRTRNLFELWATRTSPGCATTGSDTSILLNTTAC